MHKSQTALGEARVRGSYTTRRENLLGEPCTYMKFCELRCDGREGTRYYNDLKGSDMALFGSDSGGSRAV